MARRKRSYFPAANTDFPQGEELVSGGGTQNFSLLPPEQNPAYQAAIAKGRPSRSGFTTIQTPSGGSMSVPVGQERKYTDLLYKGNTTADTGFGRPDVTSAYALGDTGAIPTGNTPWQQSYRMGYQGDGTVQQSAPTFGYQAGNALRNAVPGIAAAGGNLLSGFSKNIASLFNNPQAQAYGQGVSTGQISNLDKEGLNLVYGARARNNLVANRAGISGVPNDQLYPIRGPRRYFDY